MNILLTTVVLVSCLAFATAGWANQQLALVLNAELRLNPVLSKMEDKDLLQLEKEVNDAKGVSEATLSPFSYAIYYTTNESGGDLKIKAKSTAEWGETMLFTPGKQVRHSDLQADTAFVGSLATLMLITPAIRDLAAHLRDPLHNGKKFFVGVESGLSQPEGGNRFVNHVVVIRIE